MASGAPTSASDRFELRGTIGQGGMGVVYRAFDRRRRQEVALKVLRSLDGAQLYRFKQEFRSLAGVIHPNLVTLYELHASAGEWSLSMELVDGESFLDHVRPPALDEEAPSAASAEATHTAVRPAPRARSQSSDPATGLRPQGMGPLDLARLRAAAVQLAEGVRGLHRADKLHCDLKPSNVLVERGGRVVICDFGLVRALHGERLGEGERVWGTPRYMSPEQAAGRHLDEASDWYSVGVILYAALAGRLPFIGAGDDALLQKCAQDAPPITAWTPSVHAPLEALVMQLLERSPARRPRGDEVVARLRAIADPEVAPRVGEPGPRPEAAPVLVGRERELGELRRALADARAHGVAVLVEGRSGMGKSALVRRFLDEVAADPDAVVLSGRCYERETVPYGALDAVVDALCNALVALPAVELRWLMPTGAAALVRLFPVLRRVALLDAAAHGPAPADPQELRARGFAALRELLGRLAALHRTVLYVDDLQWGDVDSGAFLLELHQAGALPLLLIAAYRAEDVETSPLLRTLAAGRGDGDVRRLVVEALPAAAAGELARAMLGDGAAGADEAAVRRVVAEAGGNPFVLAELARAGGALDGATAMPGAAALVQRRWRRLDDPARRFLAAAALAGMPTAAELLSQAAAVDDEPAALAALRSESLVRVRRRGELEEIECYHDAIREAVTAAITDAERRGLHRGLAAALEAAGDADPARLLEHWLGAGERARAGAAALIAAERAERALAFTSAGALYRRVLELSTGTDEERSRWLEHLGDSLVHSGNLIAAGDAYLEAAAASGAAALTIHAGARARRAIDLRRRAFDALLCGGDLARGKALAEEVAVAVGLRIPGGARRMLAETVVEMARLALRGPGFSVRKPDARDPEALLRIDVCRSLGLGLGFLLPVHAALFRFKQVRLALDSGDPPRALLALPERITSLSLPGGPARARIAAAAEDMRRLPGFEPDGITGRYLDATLGLATFLRGEFAAAAAALERGEAGMLEDAGQFRWQLDLARLYRLATMLYRGRIAELTVAAPASLKDALDRGDQFLAQAVRAWRSNAAWLALDRADEARTCASALAATTARAAFHLGDYFELLGHAQIDLYVGDPTRAWQRLTAAWPRLQGSLLLRTQFTRGEAAFLRGRCALALALARPTQARRLRRDVDAQVRRLRRERMPWTDAHADLLAGLATADLDPPAARILLERAAVRCDAADLALLAALARRRGGELAGGSAGAAAVAAADAWMTSEAIRAPARFAAVWAPGSR